jgi:glycosyltransferase involved in cell wall biosynthesis
VVHTSSIKERLLATFAVPAKKVVVIPAIKPVSGLRDSTITKAVARQRLEIPSNCKLLLFFGFIREYKGLSLLLDAFDQASRHDADLRLLIAGSIQSQSQLKKYQKQIQSMEHPGRVMFKADFIAKEDVDYYFRAADAMAVPYSKIDFSGILQEAMAYGLPVLATDVGNFKEFIQTAGYITSENTSEEFARIILKAFGDKEALALMGKAALAIDRGFPEWTQIGRETMEMYLSTVAQPPTTRSA